MNKHQADKRQDLAGRGTTAADGQAGLLPLKAKKCDDLGRLLCRLIDLRISIAKYLMSEHDHYERRKRKMASLLKAYVDSGDATLADKLNAVLESEFIEPKRPPALIEDMAQAIQLKDEVLSVLAQGQLPKGTEHLPLSVSLTFSLVRCTLRQKHLASSHRK